MFRRDFCKQLRAWKKDGDHLFVIMDCNESFGGPMDGALAAEGIELEEVSHHYWGQKEPHTYINCTQAINRAYKSKPLEVSYFQINSFIESPGGDHRFFIIDLTTRSMLGQFLNKLVDGW